MKKFLICGVAITLLSMINYGLIFQGDNSENISLMSIHKANADDESGGTKYLKISYTIETGTCYYYDEDSCEDGKKKNCATTTWQTITNCWAGGPDSCTPGTVNFSVDICGPCS